MREAGSGRFVDGHSDCGIHEYMKGGQSWCLSMVGSWMDTVTEASTDT